MNSMKKNKRKNQNLFQSVTDRLSRFFGKEEANEPNQPKDPITATEQGELKQDDSSGNGAAVIPDRTETPPKRVRVRRSRVRISRPKPQVADKEKRGRKKKEEAAVSIFELPSDQVGPAIRDFVVAHLSDENLCIEMMSEQLKISRTSLFTLMRREFGLTPTMFILDIRLKNAEALLKEGLKVRDVAMRCGFAKPKYFSKVFKKYYGILPSAYRA